MRKLELEKRHTKQKQMLLDRFDNKMEQIKSLHNKQMNKEHNKVKVSHFLSHNVISICTHLTLHVSLMSMSVCIL